ncbi:MAG: uracil-DNA glycosylase family protein [Nitrosopumilus sp.]
MSFIPILPDRTIMGRADADILIIGDCPDGHAIRSNKPFAGPVEGCLEQCLHNARMIKSDVLMTNIVSNDTHVEHYWNDTKHKPVRSLKEHLEDLLALVEKTKPKIIVTLGDMATWALTGKANIVDIRGYPLVTPKLGLTVIPTLHPSKCIWSNYIWRYYISHDLSKAKKFVEGNIQLEMPETIRPGTIAEAIEWLNYFKKQKKVSVDIECSNFEVSCIGFADQIDVGVSIPFDMRWSEEEEVMLWNLVADILGDINITKVGQNFIFDMHFLSYRMGIITRGKIVDTMMGHSIMFPDFLKSLNFLASIHTNRQRWKDMVKWKNIKKES